MKKTIRKLVVRRETIRGIRTLEGLDLAPVRGGAARELDGESRGANCPAADVFLVAATPTR